MNLTVNPVIPFVWWIVLAIVTVLFIFSWFAYARSKKKLNLSWFLSVGVIIALLGVTLNPGIVTSETINSKPVDQTDKVESTYDIYFVVDTTSSIAAEDWGTGEPRLVGVKQDIVSIVEQYPNARYTLMTFDSVATMLVPITNDSSALLSTTAALQQEVTGNSRGSSVGEAAGLLNETLVKNADDTRQAIVFFFSDGEQTAEGEIESYADSAEYVASGLVLGYGTEQGGRMKTRVGYAPPSEPYIQDLQGNDGFSIINEENLRTIADDLGIDYIHRAQGEALDVSPDAEGSIIGDIETKRFGVYGLYWVFALVAFLLMTIALTQMVRDIRKLRKSIIKTGGDA